MRDGNIFIYRSGWISSRLALSATISSSVVEVAAVIVEVYLVVAIRWLLGASTWGLDESSFLSKRCIISTIYPTIIQGNKLQAVFAKRQRAQFVSFPLY